MPVDGVRVFSDWTAPGEGQAVFDTVNYDVFMNDEHQAQFILMQTGLASAG